MSTPVMQTSFAAGELSPALFARVDLDKYHIGAAYMRNFFPDYRGGAATRAGTQFGGQCRVTGSLTARVIDFIVDTTNAYVVELGNYYARFYQNNQQVISSSASISAITQASPGVFTTSAPHGFTTGQEVALAGIGGMTSLNGQNYLVTVIDTTHYSLTDLYGNPINTYNLPAYTSGGTASAILTVVTPWTGSDLALLKYSQSANVMTLTHPNYPPYDLAKVSSTSFTCTLTPFQVNQVSPSGLTLNTFGNSNSNWAYAFQVTAVNAVTGEESLPCALAVVNTSIYDGGNNAGVQLTWTAPAGTISHYKIYRSNYTSSNANTSARKTVINTTLGYIGESTNASFVDSGRVAPDFTQVPPALALPFTPGQIASVTPTSSSASYSAAYTIPLIFTGTGTGAAGYGVIDPNTQEVVSAVITNPGAGYTSCTVSDSVGATTYAVTLGQSSGTYPFCVSYFQQRRVFGGTLNAPESLVFSQPGNYTNYNASPFSNASDAITASIASRQVNYVKAMVPMSTGLVVLTTGSGFLVSGGSQQAAITPASITALPQASSGANDMPPLIINYDILYCQNRGSVVRDLAFNFYVQSYTGTDRSVLSSHLFNGFTLKEWCWAEEPNRLVHVVRTDGQMLVFAYVPEQELFGWSHWDTQGLIQSVCSIPEGNTNSVYMIVQRYVNGQWVNYVERLQYRVFPNVQNSWCVDCGVQLPETYPAATLYLSAPSGTNVPATASGSVFSPSDVGKVIWAGSGMATVVGYTSGTAITVNIAQSFDVVPGTAAQGGLGYVTPYASGAWSYDTPTTTVSGLSYLNNCYITGLVDGVPLASPLLVSNGSVTLPVAATKVILGLGYKCQLQTLRIDLGQPTQQGKRKSISALTIRAYNTLGLKAGQNFSTLWEIKDMVVPYTPPLNFFTGDARLTLGGAFTVEGQVCIQQDYPLPATVLGVIPEVLAGDTQR